MHGNVLINMWHNYSRGKNVIMILLYLLHKIKTYYIILCYGFGNHILLNFSWVTCLGLRLSRPVTVFWSCVHGITESFSFHLVIILFIFIVTYISLPWTSSSPFGFKRCRTASYNFLNYFCRSGVYINYIIFDLIITKL